MDLDQSVAARALLTSLALLASAAACSAPPADGDPEFEGFPSFGNNNPPAGTALGGAGGAGSGGLPGGNLGNGGEGIGNPPLSGTGGAPGGSNGGAGNSTGNVSGTGGAPSSGMGGAPVVPAMGGTGGTDPNTPPANGGTGGDQPGNTGGTGGQPPVLEPPPTPLPSGFYLIDDFEGGRDPAWTESEVGGGAGNFTIDTAVGANGSSSSIRIDANNAFHTMLQFALPQAVRTAGEVYGRVFLRLAQNPSPSHYVWVEVGTTANDGQEMRLGHNVSRLQSNQWVNGSERDIRDRNRALVANTWYCLEFYMSDNPDELRVWLDDDETALSTTNYTAGPNAEGNTTAQADFIPPLQAFRVGWELQNGTVWFDDVALADGQIGCD